MTNSGNKAMRVVMLGTYDLGKPRTRLLREALRHIDPDLRELHFSVWHGVEDKSVMSGLGAKLGVAMRLLLAYPVLAVRYLFAGKHDLVVIGYLGLFDMLLLAPLAKLRGKPVVWDAFLSIYDTYARDRGMDAEDGWKSRLLRWMERQACHIADRVVLDTHAHAALLGELHRVPEAKLDAVLVGAESSVFDRVASKTAPHGDAVKVLFYGQFIPLHGIDTIIASAIQPRGRQFHWTIVGEGQEAARIDRQLAEHDLHHVSRIAWVNYEELADLMEQADICLGIFGTSDKAARVIPNKVFQALSAGKPLITRDSAAMRELVAADYPGLYLVAPDDPVALLDALDRFTEPRSRLPHPLHEDVRRRFAWPALVEQWHSVLEKAR